MGLGKTIQSIGFMACLQQHLNKKGPFLVVVPLSVLSNWISEIEKFCPSFRAVRFHGTYQSRCTAFQHFSRVCKPTVLSLVS